MRTAPLPGTGDVRTGRTAGPDLRGAAEAPGDPTGTTPRPAPRPHRTPVHATVILAIIFVGCLMVILDDSIICGGVLLLGARGGDLFGHRRLFLSSSIVFSPGSLLAGAARSRWCALSLSILTAVAATVSTGHEAADIAARSGAALTGSAVLLALAVLAVVTLIVPSRATPTERSL
ncbi:hypothetical protein [Streptomyces sp. GbtcB6]|uniref:hypothetical protein n=1 Tax=Streptomyces sp. GbtcB6 TaxID=2824751 RepID=UPI001C309952|nr:hypothetical protein [Streptomyces sp. GbtcB6]